MFMAQQSKFEFLFKYLFSSFFFQRRQPWLTLDRNEIVGGFLILRRLVILVHKEPLVEGKSVAAHEAVIVFTA